METKLVKTRKFNGEEYRIYLNYPSYENETGLLNVKIEPYVKVLTPQNEFGYEDTVLFRKDGNAYTLHRYLAPWVLKKLEIENRKILAEYQKKVEVKQDESL